MNKDNKKRRKAAISAVLAAGMTTGAIAACAGNESAPVQSEKSDVELSAADKVVVDGQEVSFDDLQQSQDSGRVVARPMYGVRQRPIHLMYGPRRPRPDVVNPNDSVSIGVVERQVMEVVATTLNINPMNVKVSSKLSEDLGVSDDNATQLKLALERKFDVVIFEDTFKMMSTVGDLVNCIYTLKN